MRYVLPTTIIFVAAALAGCDRPAPGTTASTTVVKEQPTSVAQSPAVVKEKETYVQHDVATPPTSTSSTTVVNPPAQSSPQPGTTERSSTTTTSRVDTPVGTATETKTESTRTSQ